MQEKQQGNKQESMKGTQQENNHGCIIEKYHITRQESMKEM